MAQRHRTNSALGLPLKLLASIITKNRVEDYNIEQVNWDSWTNFVKRNGIATFVHLALKQNPHLAVPEAAKAAVDKIFYANIRRNTILSRNLQNIVQTFSAHNIDILPFKGLILSHFLYQNSEYRQIADLDFLIRWEQFGKAIELLNGLGYRHEHLLAEQDQGLFAHFRSSTELYHQTTRLLIEPHWGIFDGYFPEWCSNSDLFDRSVVYQFDSIQTRNLDNYSLLLLLCIHPARHGWLQVVNWLDLAKFISNFSDLNWPEAADRARENGALRMVTTAVRMVCTIFNLPFPEALVRHLDPLSEQLATRFIDGLYAHKLDSRDMSHLQSLSINLKLRHRLKDKFHYCTYMLSPKRPELQSVRLPRHSYFLYYVIRFFRLFKLLRK